MADTFTAYFSGITFAAGKAMAGLLNTHATELIKIRRVGILNAQSGTVTGVVCLMEARFYPATATYTGSTAVTPQAHDTTNTAPAALTCGHNGTPGGSTPYTLRRVWWSSDEPAVGAGTIDEIEANTVLNIIWDAGYGDSNVQPLVLRQNQAFVLYNTTGAAGTLDIWIEFTRE